MNELCARCPVGVRVKLAHPLWGLVAVGGGGGLRAWQVSATRVLNSAVQEFPQCAQLPQHAAADWYRQEVRSNRSAPAPPSKLPLKINNNLCLKWVPD